MWKPSLLVCVLLTACAGVPRPQLAAADHEPRRLSGSQLYEIARALTANGDHVRAAQYYGLAQKQGVPAQQIAPRLLALYAADAQYRLAIEYAEDYLRKHPNDTRVLLCASGFYLAVGDVLGAQRSFEQLLRQTPGDPEAHFGLAALLHDAGTQRARADEHYRAYLALAPQGRHAEEARAGLLQELP